MIPTNVITGSLGAGKTTIVLNLVKQYPSEYKILWLKNEYGDVDVDTQLINQSAIQTKEIMNGCLCCVLIGKLEDALEEISKSKDIDRLIIETAGTAYPYPIYHAVNNNTELVLDSLVKVVDCLNFDRIEDKSQMAKEQAEFIDLIVFNKQEEVDANEFDRIEDEIYEIYPEVQKVKSEKGFVDREIMTGFEKKGNLEFKTHEEEHVHNEIETFFIDLQSKDFKKAEVEQFIEELKNTDIYRIKGFVNIEGKIKFVNAVNGRLEIASVENTPEKIGLVFMGEGIESMKLQIEGLLR